MKTIETQQLEQALYAYCLEAQGIVVEEVTMPADQGIVDTLACYTKNDGSREWRCYELKVSKADFRSQAKLSFVGHYNYLVLPPKLYEEIKNEVPSGIGVLVFRPYNQKDALSIGVAGTFVVEKKARRQELLVDEKELTTRFMASLFREVRKAKRMETGLVVFSTDQLIHELQRRQKTISYAQQDADFFAAFQTELFNEKMERLQAEVASLTLENTHLKKIRKRPTEPLE